MKIAILSTLALLTAGGAAQAAPHGSASPPMVSVAYADLDLSRAPDAAAMLKRIRRAAVDVCGQVGDDAESVLRFDSCYRQAVTGAVSGLNAPRVTEAFEGRASRRRLARLP